MGQNFRSTARSALAIATASVLIVTASSLAAAKPGKVTVTTKTSTASSITLKWKAASGKPTSYSVSCAATGKPTKTATTKTLTATVKNLSAFTNYKCTVTALAGKVKGTGVSVTVKTKPTVPTVPLNPGGTPGDTVAYITWTTPTWDGGSGITSYTVTSNPTGRTCIANGASTNTCTVTALTNNVTYTFTIVATNAIGNSVAATTASITPIALPNAPSVTSESSPAKIKLTWVAPTNAPVTKYVITRNDGGQSVETNNSTLTYEFTGLTNCVPIIFNVHAENAAGAGPATPITASAGGISALASEVQEMGVTAGDKKLTVTFNPPAQPGLAPITGYSVRATTDSILYTDGVKTSGNGVTPLVYEITGLSNAVTYTVTAQAITNCGTALLTTNSTKTATPVWAGRPARVIDLDQNQNREVTITDSESVGYQFTNYQNWSDTTLFFKMTFQCHTDTANDGSNTYNTNYYLACPDGQQTELPSPFVKLYKLDGTQISLSTTGGGWVTDGYGGWTYYFRPSLNLSNAQTYLIVVTYGTRHAFNQYNLWYDTTFHYDLPRHVTFWEWEYYTG